MYPSDWRPTEKQSEVLAMVVEQIAQDHLSPAELEQFNNERFRRPFTDLFKGQFAGRDQQRGILYYLAVQLQERTNGRPGGPLTIEPGHLCFYDTIKGLGTYCVVYPVVTAVSGLRPEHQLGATLLYLDTDEGLFNLGKPATEDRARILAGSSGLPYEDRYTYRWPQQ